MAAPASTTIHIRVDETLKREASQALDTLGMSLSDAVRLLLTRIAVEKAMPFEVRAPNAETVEAMKAGDRGEVSRAASVAEMLAQLHAND